MIQLGSILEGGFEVRKVVGILAAWRGEVKNDILKSENEMEGGGCLNPKGGGPKPLESQ